MEQTTRLQKLNTRHNQYLRYKEAHTHQETGLILLVVNHLHYMDLQHGVALTVDNLGLIRTAHSMLNVHQVYHR